jgi:hypothetical protein
VYAFLPSPSCATCPAHLILHLFTLITLCKYKMLPMELLIMQISSVSYLVKREHIMKLIITQFSPVSYIFLPKSKHPPFLYTSLWVRDQAWHPYKTRNISRQQYISIYLFLIHVTKN